MRYTNFHIISKISRGTRVLIRESLKIQFSIPEKQSRRPRSFSLLNN